MMNMNMDLAQMNCSQMNCEQLLALVYQASFAMDDVTLFLDSHPCDMNALNYYHYVANLRKEAMRAYQSQCGPLMIDQVESCDY
ncbi:MAG: spore coat protein CotJB [Hungatella hathewayi]